METRIFSLVVPKIKAVIYFQSQNGFNKGFAAIEKDSVYEDVSAVIDFNADKSNDLLVVSGGGENASNLQTVCMCKIINF
jgi:hypothetical protein